MIAAIVWILCTVGIEIIYHKIFNVIYIGGGALVKEITVCALIGAALAALICAYWFISIPVAILVIIAICKKNS